MYSDSPAPLANANAKIIMLENKKITVSLNNNENGNSALGK